MDSFALEDGVVSYKGDTKDGKKGISYLEEYTPDGQYSIILSKEGNMNDGYGEFIDAACGFQDTICIINCSDKTYYIELYDKSGNLQKRYDANAIMEFFKKQSIHQFLFLDEKTLFINNASGDSVLCSIGGDTLEIISKGTCEHPLYAAQTCNPQNSEKIIYELLSNKIYRVVDNELILHEIEGSIVSIYVDGKDVLYSYRDKDGNKKLYLETVDELFAN